jgi:hypothetical protein
MNTVLTSTTRSSLVNVITGSGYSIGLPKYLSFGTGLSPALPTDINLSNPLGVTITGTVSTISTVTSGDTYLCSGSFTATGITSVTEVGLFTSNSSSAVGVLASQVNPTDTTVTLNGYNAFPGTFPFNIQIASEVMTVTSGNGTNVFNVIRGANGSSSSTSIIPALTPVVGQAGYLFLKSTFPGINLYSGDTLQFNIGIQFS